MDGAIEELTGMVVKECSPSIIVTVGHIESLAGDVTVSSQRLETPSVDWSETAGDCAAVRGEAVEAEGKG